MALSSEYSKLVFKPINDKSDRPPPGFAIAGGAPGISAFFDRNCNHDYAIIVLSNYDPKDTEPVYNLLRELVENE